MNASFPEKLTGLARAQVGVRESGVNGGLTVRMYQSATTLDPGSWPWCAAFVAWCVKYAAASADVTFPLPRSPLVAAWEPWARKNFALVMAPKQVIAGDVVIFKFDSGWHIGIAVRDSSGTTVDTVEGNTNASGGREGDGVYRRKRNLSSIRSIIAWNRAKPIKP